MKKVMTLALCLAVVLGFTGCGKSPVQYTLTITINGEGTVIPASGGKYDAGTVVNLVPTAAEGWTFASWNGPDGDHVVTSADTHTIVMDKDRNVNAVFTFAAGTSVSGIVTGKETLVGIPNVIVEYSGAISGQTITDAAGQYVISNVTGPIKVKPLGLIDTMVLKSDPTEQDVSEPDSNVDFVVFGIAYDADWQVETSFDHPERIAVDSAGMLYVTSTNTNQVFVYNSDGEEQYYWGSAGDGNGQLAEPTGIAVDSLGHVYVADEMNDRVQKFLSNGGYVSQLGGYGEEPGMMKKPKGLAVDAQDNLYVIERPGQRVQVFSPNGTLLYVWGGSGFGSGKFYIPTSIALDSSSNVYVVDQGNNLIQKFDSTGAFIKQWGNAGSGNGLFYNAEDIAVDGNYVFVVDQGNCRIQIFTTDGLYVDQWGSEGSSAGQFNFPRGITIDNAGNIYIADRFNNRLQKYYQFK